MKYAVVLFERYSERSDTISKSKTVASAKAAAKAAVALARGGKSDGRSAGVFLAPAKDAYNPWFSA